MAVTVLSGAMRRNAFGTNSFALCSGCSGANLESWKPIQPEGGGVLQEAAAVTVSRDVITGSSLELARSLVDCGADSMIGAAAANVAVHRQVDVTIAWVLILR